MNKERLRYLLEQRLADKATPGEEHELTALLQADSHAGLFQELMAEMMLQETPAMPGDPADWQKMAQQIAGIDKSSVQPAGTGRRVFSMYRWAAAAALVLICGAATYFVAIRRPVSHRPGPDNTVPALAVTDFSQDKLLLPGGSQILLGEEKNGVIANIGDITITKHDKQIVFSGAAEVDETGNYLLTTARGSNYDIVLTDGSQVSLNAASSLRFPGVFSGAIRSVDLAGEAWFDVQHADRLPFAIRSGQHTTTVLGTAFDIKAYRNQRSITVAVQRGKVRVVAGNKILAVLLKGQQAKLTGDSPAVLHQVDPSSVGAWKQGNLDYDDDPVLSIVADLQRVFNDSISIQTRAIKNTRITARYHKKDGLEQILTMICNLGDGKLSKKNGIFIIE